MPAGRSQTDNRPDIWVVEDSPIFRETVVEMIERTGYLRCTGSFPDCESALREVTAGRLPTCVMMDIALPGIDGIEGVRRFRARAPSVPVIMLTVHQSADRIFEAICAGASGYLLKSTEREGILRAIDQLLAGGAPIDAQIARRVLDMFTRLAGRPGDYGLTNREREILQLLVDGLTKQAIAERLALSPHTIDGHVRNIYAKLHVTNRAGAVARAVKERLV